MARPKIVSQERIVEVAKQEFLAKGFEKASLRSIASQINMTPAALYKHYKDKEDMFVSLVQPAIDALNKLAKVHENLTEQYLHCNKTISFMNGNNAVAICKELIYKYQTEFKLILCCAHGTRYENFINDVVNIETEGTYKVIKDIAKLHNKELEVTKDEIHVLLSAYLTAIFEPIVHDWPLEKAIHVLNVIEKFFVPSWEKILQI